MIKAIFFDIDGTLVDRKSKAHETTRKAIQIARSKGILCGIATGRSPINIMEMIDQLDLDMFVVYNGQLVYTKDEDIYCNPFTPKVLAEIVAFADSHHRQIIFGSRDELAGSRTVMLGNSSFAKKFVRYLPETFVSKAAKKLLQKASSFRGLSRYKKLPILKKDIFQCVLLSPEAGDGRLQKLLPNCGLQRSNPFSVDITPKDGSKIHGIQAFIDYKGIQLSEVMAFGDNLNDIEMLENVGVGVAMGNGRDEVKEIADYVTGSNEASGIAEALQHFGIIDEVSA